MVFSLFPLFRDATAECGECRAEPGGHGVNGATTTAAAWPGPAAPGGHGVNGAPHVAASNTAAAWHDAAAPDGHGVNGAPNTAAAWHGAAGAGSEGDYGRGRRRRRDNGDGGPPRRRRRRDRSSSSSSESPVDELDVDRRHEHRMAPLVSHTSAAPADLRLPAIQTRAERRLRNRRNYVSVAEATDSAVGGPGTALEYLGRVAGILAHLTYHFPQCGLQVAGYLVWLIARSQGRTLREVQTADSRARQAMALRPRDF